MNDEDGQDVNTDDASAFAHDIEPHSAATSLSFGQVDRLLAAAGVTNDSTFPEEAYGDFLAAAASGAGNT